MVDLHIHSTFSDGLDKPADIVDAAIGLGLKHICITDHVTACIPWLDEYAGHIRDLAEKYRNHIEVLCGIEAKVVDIDGNLDALDEFYSKVDLVFSAFHDIPTEDGPASSLASRPSPRRLATCWFNAFRNMLKNPNIHIVAHPTAVLGMYGIKLSRTRKIQIARLVRQTDIALERNVKYGVPDKEFLRIIAKRRIPMTRGTDSHSIAQLVKNNRGALPRDPARRVTP